MPRIKKIRSDSQIVRRANDGLVAFLYDEAHADAIRKAKPRILKAFGEREAGDTELARLAKQGKLVAVELTQDDDFSIEIAGGKPLTGAELKKAVFGEPQRAYFSAPSGTVAIEGYDNLRLSPDRDPEAEPGPAIDLAPGDYVLSLYRLDWSAAENEKWTGAEYIVVFTPAADSDAIDAPAPVLRVPAGAEDDGAWVGAYSFKSGVFRGLAKYHPDSMAWSVNVDPAAAKTLGLETGGVLLIESKDDEWATVFIGETIAEARPILELLDEDPMPDVWLAEWASDSDDAKKNHLMLQPTSDTAIPDDAPQGWIPVTIRLEPDSPFLE